MWESIWNLLTEHLLLILILLFVVVMGGLLFLIFAASLFEKQRIQDMSLAGRDEAPPESGYFRAMNDAAGKIGFVHCGNFSQSRKSALYQACMALWLSPEPIILLCVGGGKIARINYKRTSLISCLQDGRVLVTVDDTGSEDLSGARQVELVLNGNLEELAQRHTQRLARAGSPARSFARQNALAQYEELQRMRVDRLVELGHARYVDPARNIWKHTFKGAWSNATKGFVKGLVNADSQEDRLNKKRPGS